jgi:hypothetical protein
MELSTITQTADDLETEILDALQCQETDLSAHHLLREAVLLIAKSSYCDRRSHLKVATTELSPEYSLELML